MKKNAGVLLLASLAAAFSAFAGFTAAVIKNNNEPEAVKAASYSTSEKAMGTYWDGVDLTGATYGANLLSALHTHMKANGSATGSNSYSALHNILAASDSNPDDTSQVYGFYRNKSVATSWNKEHCWPNSRGAGENAGYAGTDPQVIRPTNTSDNSSRSNYMYAVTSSPSTANGWDPNSFGYANARGEAARIIFYACARYYGESPAGAGGSSDGGSTPLHLTDNASDSTSNNSMGRVSALLTWNDAYAVTPTETRRNNVLWNNNFCRNPFIDHPEIADYIWDSTGTYGGTSSNNYLRTVAPTTSTSPKVTVASSSASVNKGSTTTVQATATNFDGTVTWSVSTSASTVATATVSSSGLVTISGVKGGSATITVSATYSGTTKSATIAVTVNSTDPTLTVSSSTASVKTSATTTLTLTASNFSGTPAYSQTSSNSSIATCSVSGTTLTISGVAVGSATLTITATSGSQTASATVAVTVTDASAYDGTFHLVTSTSDIVAGKKYLIASAGAAGSASFLSTSIVSTYYQGITSNTINSDLSVTPSASTEQLVLGGSSGAYTFATSVRTSNTGTLCVSGTYQNLVAVSSPTSTDYSTWSIAIDSSTHTATIKNTAYTAADRYVEYYSGKSEFTSYATVSTVYLFVENDSTPAKTLSSLSVSGTPTTTSYTAGQSFSATGLTVTAHYSDSSTADVTSSVVWTPSPLTAGTTSVTGTYGGQTVTVSGLTVAAATVTLSSIAVTTQPTKTTYTVGDTLDTTGLVVTATYSDGSTAAVTGYTLSPANGSTLSTAGSQTITVTYSGKTTTFAVTVNSASGSSTTYTLITSTSGLVSGSKYIIASADSTSGYAMSSTQNDNNRGNEAVTISSDSKITATDTIEQLTLGGDATNGWSLYANKSSTQGYLYAASSTKNYLHTVTTNDSNGLWDITISSNAATITAKGSNTHKILKWNSSSSIFSCYASGQAAVYLYKQDATGSSDATKASQWAAAFNTAFGNVCQADGSTAVSAIQTAWSTQYNNFGNLASTVQALLTASTSTDTTIIAMWAKYAYIYGKYGSSLSGAAYGGDYLNKLSGAYRGSAAKSDAIGAPGVILVASVFLATGALGFYLVKKKKHA